MVSRLLGAPAAWSVLDTSQKKPKPKPNGEEIADHHYSKLATTATPSVTCESWGGVVLFLAVGVGPPKTNIIRQRHCCNRLLALLHGICRKMRSFRFGQGCGAAADSAWLSILLGAASSPARTK
jgi:hypothetical protein